MRKYYLWPKLFRDRLGAQGTDNRFVETGKRMYHGLGRTTPMTEVQRVEHVWGPLWRTMKYSPFYDYDGNFLPID
jgi:hypothetical protein